MRKLAIWVGVTSALVIGAIAYAQSMRSGQPAQAGPWTTMGGGTTGPMWPMGPRWQGQGPIPRDHVAMMSGIPEPYASMTNPLPHTQATLERGAKVYASNCVACHGQQGLDDGPVGRALSPAPGNLAWLSDMPMGQWDPFIYWTVAEGGAPFGTAMPAFKDSLSKDQIWAVTAYIQAHLPQATK
jgi:mono/diheme cytochrome c family protein